MELKGDLISIRPAKPTDKIRIFKWLTKSNLTPKMLGLPNFPENPIPQWEEFDKDYAAFYFDGSDPFLGRSFIIYRQREQIGQINYSEIHTADGSVELDIWLKDKKFTGKGFGTEALLLLSNYLFNIFNCFNIYIAPSIKNINAVRSYQKAGFIATDEVPDWFIPDYTNTVLMVKRNYK